MYSLIEKEILFVKRWMLPIAMVLGISIYLFLHFVPGLSGAETVYMNFASKAQPVMIAIMLFLQLNVVAPTDMKFHKWHFEMLALQAILFTLLGLLSSALGEGVPGMLAECAMLCIIAPTAAAAGVVTNKIGGSISGVITYLVMSNTLASVMIPLVAPMVHPNPDATFLASFWIILKRVFSILLLPCALAWFIRYFIPSLQKFFARYLNWAFYIWGIGLTLALSLATKALVMSGLGVLPLILIGIVSLVCCFGQFALGRRVARKYGHSESITAGQSIGQKNTGFIIWVGLNFLTPVTSVAAGLYAIWHNIVNSYEIHKVEGGGTV